MLGLPSLGNPASGFDWFGRSPFRFANLSSPSVAAPPLKGGSLPGDFGPSNEGNLSPTEAGLLAIILIAHGEMTEGLEALAAEPVTGFRAVSASEMESIH